MAFLIKPSWNLGNRLKSFVQLQTRRGSLCTFALWAGCQREGERGTVWGKQKSLGVFQSSLFNLGRKTILGF